ncbi:hypothetical protein D3C87_1908450 [compost metagenome]
MEGNFRGDVDIGDTVAIGQAEGLVGVQMLADAPDTAARHGVHAGIDDGHLPAGL